MSRLARQNLYGVSQTREKRNACFSLAVKTTVLIVFLIFSAASVTTCIVYNLGRQALQEQIQEKLMMIASNAAAALDVDKLTTIRSRRDEGNETYLALQKQLQGVIRASMGKIRYVYTIAKKGKKYIFVLDASPIQDKRNHSSVGDEFPVQDFPDALTGFVRPVAERAVSYDKRFNLYSQSGYAPIRDRYGRVVGVLGVDMDVGNLKKEERNMKAAAGVALLVSSLLAIGMGVAFSIYLTRPIYALTDGALRVAKGDLDTVVTVPRRDEFGKLAEAFNVMTRDLKLSRAKLKEYNRKLEAEVAERTEELSRINKELRDILDNMSQAIFTVGKDLRFNPQHSKYARNIFGDMDFAGKELTEVFFPAEEQREDRENIAAWLATAFEKPFMKWEDIEALQPVRQIALKAKDSAGREVTKHIEVAFQPITDICPPDYQEKIVKIMVIVQDITEKKTLEQEMKKKEQEYKDNINQIVEIVRADQELFEEFVNECREQLFNLEPKLIALKENKGNRELIDDLFRIMHTIKGNSRLFNLQRIAGEAHAIEEIFSAVRRGESALTDELLNETFKKLDRFHALFNETLNVYRQIVQGGKIDTGRTRAEKRTAEEAEIVRVRIKEIQRLTELFAKMNQLVLAGTAEAASGNLEKLIEVADLFKEAEERLQALRKVAIGRLFARFPRMVRDISTELGKKARLVTEGGETEIDKNIFDWIADPLIHLVRNSLDHGIETPQERIMMGKPEEGIIRLQVNATESELSIEIMDDGRGLDIEKIKAKAAARQLLPPDKALKLSDDEAASLIFLPGFSTNDMVTTISGRGVGMDVVKTYIEGKLNGKVILQSQKNKGLKVTLKVPLFSNSPAPGSPANDLKNCSV